MKGWIKVHGANKTWQDKYLRAQDIYAIEEYTEDEKEGYKPFSCTLINDCYYVSESVEKVLALIEKAENGEEETTAVTVIEADKLLEWLGDKKEEAECEGEACVLPRKYYEAYAAAIVDVIQHVEREAYLVSEEN